MAYLKNTSLTTYGSIQPPAGTSTQRTASNTRTVVNLTSGSGSWTVPAGVTTIQVLVIGGGGGGGSDVGCGGGAGGVVYSNGYAVTPGATISYSIGSGGAAGGVGNNGGNTTFGTITAYGGGGGAYYYDAKGSDGGSGGGGHTGVPNSSPRFGGSPTGPGNGVPGQGFPGGNNLVGGYNGGGGGGAGGPGANGLGYGAAGGIGLPFSISGTTQWYAGGGGAGSSNYVGPGGLGGGGDGDVRNAHTAGTYSTRNGVANTGGGGGGEGGFNNPGSGGSGVIIISYVPDTYIGQFRYNSDGAIAEVYEATGWKSLLPKSNNGSSNALYYSNDLTNGIWTKENTTITSGQIAPDSTTTAFLLTDTTATGDHRLYQLPTLGSGSPGIYVASVYVKYNSTTRYVLVRHSGSVGYCYFDILNRVVTESINGGIGEIIPADNGWIQLKVTGWTNTVTYTDVVVALSTVGTGGGTNPSYTGSGSNSIYIWKPELSTATDINANGYRTHIYRNQGANQAFTPDFTGNVEVLVVGGGGSGASSYAGTGNGPRGGGGAGGVIYISNMQVTAGTRYDITVGSGGAAVNGNNVNGNQGGNSKFGNIVALGGGFGGYYNAGNPTAGTGGSGGGNSYTSSKTGGQPGAGNYGSGGTSGAGGGGGAASNGSYNQDGDTGGDGGRGIGYDISGTLTYYGGGGGAGGYPQGRNCYGLGGLGGGGRGGQGYDQSSQIAGPQGGWNGHGGGGGAGGSGAEGGAGGSGIVIVRYQAPTKCAIIYQSGNWTCPPGVTNVKALIVAGGGGGGCDMGGGGGAGGLIYNPNVTVDAGKTYSITIGAGGAGARARNLASERGNNGGNTTAFGYTAIGGGGGASFHDVSTYPASTGGSGGGASGGAQSPSGGQAGAGGYGGGAAASGTAGQGNAGSFGIYAWYPGGGGGAGSAGSTNPAKGGDGLPFNLVGTMLYFAGGGGGAGYSAIGGNGGLGGGGAGAVLTPVYGGGWSLNWGQYGYGGRTGWQIGYTGSPAGANTGGGGGGGAHYNNANEGGNGGSGVVIIKWD